VEGEILVQSETERERKFIGPKWGERSEGKAPRNVFKPLLKALFAESMPAISQKEPQEKGK